jgi:hypothetical protein
VHQGFVGVGCELRWEVRKGAVFRSQDGEDASSVSPGDDWSLWRGQADGRRRARSCAQVSVLSLRAHFLLGRYERKGDLD